MAGVRRAGDGDDVRPPVRTVLTDGGSISRRGPAERAETTQLAGRPRRSRTDAAITMSQPGRAARAAGSVERLPGRCGALGGDTRRDDRAPDRDDVAGQRIAARADGDRVLKPSRFDR